MQLFSYIGAQQEPDRNDAAKQRRNVPVNIHARNQIKIHIQASEI